MAEGSNTAWDVLEDDLDPRDIRTAKLIYGVCGPVETAKLIEWVRAHGPDGVYEVALSLPVDEYERVMQIAKDEERKRARTPWNRRKR